MDPMLVWGLILFGLAILVAVFELFIPSAGVLAAVAGLTAVAGVVCLFIYDTTWGIVGLLVVLIMGPVGFVVGMNLWTKTAIGRHMIGAPTEAEEHAALEKQQHERAEREALIGLEGEAVTPLRPIGVVRIEGKRYDAHAEVQMVARGERVRVTAADGMQIKVRKVDA